MNQTVPVATTERSGIFRNLAQEFKKSRREKWGNLWGYVFIAPAMILYLVFNVWPMFRGFLMAFTDYRFMYPATRWDFNGIANFVEMFSDKYVGSGLMIAFKYALIVVPASLAIALFLAVLISKVRTFGGFYRWVVYLPVILPTAVTILLWKEFLNNKFGFINSFLRLAGVENPPNWLGSVQYALPSAAMVDIWRGIGFPTLLFLIGIYNINSELYEAASIDGANGWQQFYKITLPLLTPVFAIILVLNSAILGVTDVMLLLTQGGPQNSTLSIGLHLYQTAFRFGDLRLGYAAAVSLVLGLLGALISIFWIRTLRGSER